MKVGNNGAASLDATPLASPALLRALHPVNLLSFGPNTPEIPLGPLNILIGPNGSGKSNLIEAVCLLRSAAKDIRSTVRSGGGVTEWIWKGSSQFPAFLKASFADEDSSAVLTHEFRFIASGAQLLITEEFIRRTFPPQSGMMNILPFVNAHPHLYVKTSDDISEIPPDSFDVNDSVFAQLRDPVRYPEITHLYTLYSRITAYREWQFGRDSLVRRPQRADMRTDRLEEDFSNLGLFLNRLRRTPDAKNMILARLRDLYEGVDDFDVSIEGGTVQVFFTEGRFTIPATRLSDGTLRYLCLLAILCDPTPPPLICIEKPELGLHPDILPKIADLLVDASTRTQLIVTTHSDILVDAMTERPECVLVCEKREGQTHIERLNAADLAIWTEKYRLGELWTRGELGGVRW